VVLETVDLLPGDSLGSAIDADRTSSLNKVPAAACASMKANMSTGSSLSSSWYVLGA